MKLWVVYDDRKIVSSEVSAFVSVGGYGSIVFRQKTLASRLRAICAGKGWTFFTLTDALALAELKGAIDAGRVDRLLWLPASFAPLGGEETGMQMERMLLVDGTCAGSGAPASGGIAAIDAGAGQALDALARGDALPSPDCYVDLTRSFVDVSDLTNLVDYLSGALGARHFNSMKRESGKITKFSRNVAKIRAEHDYFHLLPDAMKRWLVMPFDYTEADGGASYAMERLMLLDMGQQWINGGMSLHEFGRFLEDIFRFIDERPRRPIGKDAARAHFRQLYIDKVKQRFAELQGMEVFRFVEDMARATGEPSLAAIFERYYAAIAPHVERAPEYECIGHGDACFSNILYDRRTRFLKLIDPKGATCEDQLYTDPLYDIAKLSHSVLGGYDFVSNGLYDITLGADLRLHLNTPEARHAEYARLFVAELARRNLDPALVRLLEASLFLSMLPLHADKPRNVLAFVLIALHILREVESNTHA